MKQLCNFLGILAAGAFGYIFEPNLRPQLTGVDPSSDTIGEIEGSEIPSDAPQIDLASLTASQLPDRVVLKTDARVADSASGVVMTIDAGNRVKLVRIDGSEAVISPGEGPFIGRIPVADTDLLQQLASNPAPPATEEDTSDEISEPAPPPAPAEPEVAMDDVAEKPAADEEPEGAPATEPAAAADPEPAEDSMPTPEPAASAGDNDPVKAMQASIQAAAINEFTFDQVLNWEAGPEETVDGESYQTGLASYKAETIFGVKTIQAKALIKDGKVQRWIWPKSGMEIK